MKDYLSSSDRLTLIGFLKLVEGSEKFTKGNLLTNKEKGDLKRGCTNIVNSIMSLLKRLNPDAIKAFNRSIKDVDVFATSKSELAIYQKRKSSEIEASYEENKEYFKLVELILHYNCRDCKKHCTECEIYKEFEAQAIPEFDGVIPLDNCKYAYRNTDVGGATDDKKDNS